MSYCGDTTLVKRTPGLYTARPLRCRAWSCVDCVDGRKRRLMAEAMGGNPRTFLTLTSRRQPGQTPAQAAKALSHAWRKLRLRIMRHLDTKKLPFIAVFEATKLGWPHLHILLRSPWLDQRWLSAQMDELLQSPVVDIRRIKSKRQVVGYVAKYCGKAPHQFGSSKRYWKSKDYEQRPDRKNKPVLAPGEYFEVIPTTLNVVVSHWIQWGYAVEVEGSRCARARPP